MKKDWGNGKKRSVKKNAHKKRGFIKSFFLLAFFILLMASLYTMYNMDKKIMPAILSATDMLTKSHVNQAINNSLSKVIDDMDLRSDDFYYRTENSDGKFDGLSVNTILVNQICNEIAVDISTQLNSIGSQKVSLPMGSIMGINAFANMGPKYTISVLPMGDAVVDYSSSFESVGINQVNFQIWLDIETKIQVINPLQNTDVFITRKVSLVNTVITGEVPPTYLNTAPRTIDSN